MVSWSLSWAGELAGSLPAGVCLPTAVLGVKLGKDVPCTGSKPLSKVGWERAWAVLVAEEGQPDSQSPCATLTKSGLREWRGKSFLLWPVLVPLPSCSCAGLCVQCL